MPLEVPIICQETSPAILPWYGAIKVQILSLRNQGREDELCLPKLITISFLLSHCLRNRQ